MPEKDYSYRIIRIREDFVEQMKEMALRENLSIELAELIAQKLIEMSLPEEYYSLSRIAAMGQQPTAELLAARARHTKANKF